MLMTMSRKVFVTDFVLWHAKRHQEGMDMYIQLFRERMSIKAYAKVPKGFMGNACLQLSDPEFHCVLAHRKKNL